MHTQTIEYNDNDTTLIGYLAYDNSHDHKRPAVLIAHDWTGRNEFACKKAEKLAQLGYVGFAIDMYGNARLGKDNTEKSAFIQPFLENRKSLQQRMLTSLEILASQNVVDKTQIAAIGFCFGGLCALDLARTGADIKGVVSFHGLFNAPDNIPHPTIKAKILALHGHDDPMGTPEQVVAFQSELTRAKADWQMHIYGNTMHAFTNPLAHDKDFGTVYDATAEKRSWIAMKNFFEEIFTST